MKMVGVWFLQLGSLIEEILLKVRVILFFFPCRALQGEINGMYQLQRQHQREHIIVPTEGPSREAHLQRKRERLEAREEVLEEHNYQLQVQLHRFRILLQQVQAKIELQRSQYWV